MTRKRLASSVDRSLAGSYFDKAIKFRADAETNSAATVSRCSAYTQRSRTETPLRYSRQAESPRAEIIATPLRFLLR